MELTKTQTLQNLQSKIIHCKSMMPAAKGLAGMILFKIENNIALDITEEKFYEELHLFFESSN